MRITIWLCVLLASLRRVQSGFRIDLLLNQLGNRSVTEKSAAQINFEGVDSKVLFLYDEDAFYSTKQSQRCLDIFDKLKLNRSLPEWAWRMIDASAKLQSGLAAGNVMSLGDYDECMEIQDMQDGITSKYCLVAYKIREDMPLLYGVCIPRECNLGAMLPAHKHNFYVRDDLCDTNDNVLDFADLICIVFLMCSLSLAALATVYDRCRNKDSEEGNELLLAFSMYSNTKKIFTINPSKFSCLYGIRVISMMYIMFGHRTSVTMHIPSFNLLEIYQLQHSNTANFIYAANFSVDTFFYIGGFLIGYYGLKRGLALDFGHVPRILIHRIMRIYPSVLVLFLLLMTLSRRIGSGPFYKLGVENARLPCIQHWISYFLLFQNYNNPENLCLSHTWYLNVDMQIYFASPLLLIPLGKLLNTNRQGLISLFFGTLITLSIVIPTIIAFAENSFNVYATHHRLSVFLIGLYFGMKNNQMVSFTEKMNRIAYHLIWVLVLVTMVLIASPSRHLMQEPNSSFSILLAGLGRPLWCLGLTWVIFNCAMGQAEPINRFLSCPLFEVTSRLTFCMFLIHNFVIGYSEISLRNSFHVSIFYLFQAWLADVVITIAFSFLWTLLFESPIIIIDRILFGEMDQRVLAEFAKKCPDIAIRQFADNRKRLQRN